MGQEQNLGNLEELVLLTVLRLGNRAYGATVRQELRRRAGRSLTVSTVYVTLMRLEEKGLVSSVLEGSTPTRGGRAKRFFRITTPGIAALQKQRAVMQSVWEGLDADISRPMGAADD